MFDRVDENTLRKMAAREKEAAMMEAAVGRSGSFRDAGLGRSMDYRESANQACDSTSVPAPEVTELVGYLHSVLDIAEREFADLNARLEPVLIPLPQCEAGGAKQVQAQSTLGQALQIAASRIDALGTRIRETRQALAV